MDKNTVLSIFALYLFANEQSKYRLMELGDNEMLKTNMSNKILIETLAVEIGLSLEELKNKKDQIKRTHIKPNSIGDLAKNVKETLKEIREKSQKDVDNEFLNIGTIEFQLLDYSINQYIKSGINHNQEKFFKTYSDLCKTYIR